MLYKLINKETREECGFSKKQMNFLAKYLNIHAPIFQDKFEVVNMADEPNKEEVEKQIKELEEKKEALDKETTEKKEGIDKEIEEKKKSLEEKPAEGGENPAA